MVRFSKIFLSRMAHPAYTETILRKNFSRKVFRQKLK